MTSSMIHSCALQRCKKGNPEASCKYGFPKMSCNEISVTSDGVTTQKR